MRNLCVVDQPADLGLHPPPRCGPRTCRPRLRAPERVGRVAAVDHLFPATGSADEARRPGSPATRVPTRGRGRTRAWTRNCTSVRYGREVTSREQDFAPRFRASAQRAAVPDRGGGRRSSDHHHAPRPPGRRAGATRCVSDPPSPTIAAATRRLRPRPMGRAQQPRARQAA